MKAQGAKEIERAARAYFEDCAGRAVCDPASGQPFLDQRTGLPLRQGTHPPTPAGLAGALGFGSVRQMQAASRKGGERGRAVAAAMLQVQAYAEGLLFEKEGREGAAQVLARFFADWGEFPLEDASGGPLVEIRVTEPTEQRHEEG